MTDDAGSGARAADRGGTCRAAAQASAATGRRRATAATSWARSPARPAAWRSSWCSASSCSGCCPATRPARWAAAGSRPRSSSRRSGRTTASTSRCSQQFLTYLKNTLTGRPRRLLPLPGAGLGPDPRPALADAAAGRHSRPSSSAVIGVYLGVISAWNRGKAVDRIATGTTLTLYSMPEWWLGLLLIAAFAVGIGPLPGIFPTGGLHSVDAEPGTVGYVARHGAGTWCCPCSRSSWSTSPTSR